MNTEHLKKEVFAREKWLRALFMVIFLIINYFAQMLVWLIALFQFLLVLFTGKTNTRLMHFGQSLSKYVMEMIRYLTYNTETKPFPFNEWPASRKHATRALPEEHD